MANEANDERPLWRLGNTLKNTTKALIGAYLGLFIVEISVAASSLPYVYVSDPRANCGARFLVYFSVTQMLTSGGLLFGLSVNLMASQAPPLRSWMEQLRQAFHFGVAALAALLFFGMALNQLVTLRTPPPLPADLTHCEHIDQQLRR